MKKMLKICMISLLCLFMVGCQTWYQFLGVENGAQAHAKVVNIAKVVCIAILDAKIDTMVLDTVVKNYMKSAAEGLVNMTFAKLDKVYQKYTQKQMVDDCVAKVETEIKEMEKQAMAMKGSPQDVIFQLQMNLEARMGGK